MTTAPALKRGLDILNVLNQHEALSLDYIARKTAVPKASVLRLLQTLVEFGAVRKEQNGKQYRALAALVPHQRSFAQDAREIFKQLATESAACVEWYEPSDQGMRITQRLSAAENEVQVHARQGFVRRWHDEIDAVAAVAQVFYEHTPSVDPHPHNAPWIYDQHGERTTVTPTMFQEVCQEIKRTQMYCDRHYNSNGVKRMAAVLQHDGVFQGVIALAMSFRPQLGKEIAHKQQLLMQVVHKMQKLHA